MNGTPIGLTRDAGFEIGVSRTVDAPPGRVWEVLVSEAGVATWLGPGVRLPADPTAAKGTPTARPTALAARSAASTRPVGSG